MTNKYFFIWVALEPFGLLFLDQNFSPPRRSTQLRFCRQADSALPVDLPGWHQPLYLKLSFETVTDLDKFGKMCKQPSEERTPREKVKATLYLEDGSKFEGYSFGADQGVGGEVGESHFCTFNLKRSFFKWNKADILNLPTSLISI